VHIFFRKDAVKLFFNLRMDAQFRICEPESPFAVKSNQFQVAMIVKAIYNLRRRGFRSSMTTDVQASNQY